jgi:flagellar biosynthesis GTPase FlhF
MTISKYKTIISIFILTTIAVTGFAQVNRDELQDLPPVVFINYEGPHAWVNTREEIRQIGVALGQQIAERGRGIAPTLEAMTFEERRAYSYRFETGALNRYFVIHSVSGPEDNKLDADILGLGVDAGVDHIRNLRVIIQGYLQAAYNYSASDALLLAEYITIYNAVYRGNWDYFTSRYKTPVIGHLTRDRAGLSIRYDEWPGRTLIVIPLGHGGLSSVDTAAISDRRVIEEMRREDDQGITQRQDLVDLMEREAEEAERRAQAERERIREEERRIADERQRVEQERQRIEQERRRLEEEQEQRRRTEEQVRQTQEEQERRRVAEEESRRTQEELNRREEETRQLEQEIDRREEDLEQRREEAQRLEDFAEERAEDAQRHRQDIAEDQQAVIVQETTGGLIGITIERTSPTSMGRLIRFNPINGRELRRSPMNTIHVRTVTFIGGRIIAIAGENVGQGAVRLVELNQDSLEMARQGDTDIRVGSLLWINGNDIYAITTDLRNNQCFLGRFNTNLELQARSAVRIHPEASVTIQQGRLLTQHEDGSALALNPADLTEVQ